VEIWLGDEIIWFWGKQNTMVKSEQAGWGIGGGSQKVVSDEKPSSRDMDLGRIVLSVSSYQGGLIWRPTYSSAFWLKTWSPRCQMS
jgi:hypothetical protein